MQKLHVFGDTGGHAPQLMAALTALGVDLKTQTIPKGTTILHCGDLIHKGPDSEFLISLVHTLMVKNPGQWLQVLGNHEFQHLGGPSFWRCDCSANQVAVMQHWYQTGAAKVAFGFDNIVPEKLTTSARDDYEPENSSWLFTHAGLTKNFWTKLHKPETAAATAAAINNLSVKAVTLPGAMLFPRVDFRAGPVWALSTEEVFASWENLEGVPTPHFNQVYGHTTPYSWRSKSWFSPRNLAVRHFREKTKLNPERRRAITKLDNGSLLVGVDPGFDVRADIPEQTYLTFTKWAI